MTTAKSPNALPSARWSSFDTWDYNGMKERLERQIAKLDTSVLVRHAQQVLGQNVTMSDPFSAGQYWICFEMIAQDDSLVIARVRLPRHPDMPATYGDDDEQYSIDCEVAAMTLVRQKLPGLNIPRLYAYEGVGSDLASSAGAPYMLLEGFDGNTLQDVEFDMCQLPVSALLHDISIPVPSHYFIQNRLTDLGRNSGAHHRPVDESTGRDSNPGIPRHWVYLFDFRARRAHHWQAGHCRG
ncbi:hypothetical protein IMZ48_41810 [Candidatus Bathyarchaeota archaeon]|nr:hypothetical protein [Candidatus Bathyarchaeota archaeon]